MLNFMLNLNKMPMRINYSSFHWWSPPSIDPTFQSYPLSSDDHTFPGGSVQAGGSGLQLLLNGN